MDIEERIYQSDFWGECPELPHTFPPVEFGCKPQWEEIQQELIKEQSKDAVHIEVKSGFQMDFEEGWV